MKNKLKEIECIICNEKVTEEISKLSHTHNYTETVVDATCTDKGFINMVFTDEEKALIKTTLVDNSAATTDNFVNKYVCNNTNDKVYLLSFMDLLDINYGFNSNIFDDEKRVIYTSDYAKCTDTYYSTNYNRGNALWISRSPDSTNAKGIFIVNEKGMIVSDTLGRNLSIIPAITISK